MVEVSNYFRILLYFELRKSSLIISKTNKTVSPSPSVRFTFFLVLREFNFSKTSVSFWYWDGFGCQPTSRPCHCYKISSHPSYKISSHSLWFQFPLDCSTESSLLQTRPGAMFSSRSAKDCQERTAELCQENSVVQPLLTDLYQVSLSLSLSLSPLHQSLFL